MADHAAALEYLGDLRKSKGIALAAHEILAALGCDSYVKTIYIGYDFGGEMVAALYGRADHVEIALALPEDFDERLLVDASHLTWRTLPVAAILRKKSDMGAFRRLAELACERVRSSEHDVLRDNDFFMKAKKHRRP